MTTTQPPDTSTPSSTDSTGTPSSDSQSSTDNTAAVIGGVVAVILIIAITIIAIITIMALIKESSSWRFVHQESRGVSLLCSQLTTTTARPLLSLCLSHRHGLVPLACSPAVETVAITTTTNTAYEVMKQGGGQEGDHEYELVSSPGGAPSC